MMFPGAGAQIYYNSDGEPLGWDEPAHDDGEYDDLDRDWDPDADDDEEDEGDWEGDWRGSAGDEPGGPPQDIEDRWDDPDTNDGIEFADERDNT